MRWFELRWTSPHKQVVHDDRWQHVLPHEWRRRETDTTATGCARIGSVVGNEEQRTQCAERMLMNTANEVNRYEILGHCCLDIRHIRCELHSSIVAQPWEHRKVTAVHLHRPSGHRHRQLGCERNLTGVHVLTKWRGYHPRQIFRSRVLHRIDKSRRKHALPRCAHLHACNGRQRDSNGRRVRDIEALIVNAQHDRLEPLQQ